MINSDRTLPGAADAGPQHAPASPFSATLDRLLEREVNPGGLLAFVLAVLAVQNLLLWRFLDFAPLWAYGLGILLLVGLCAVAGQRVSEGSANGPSIGTLLVCFIVSLGFFTLGGEGRFFYANVDWQVRDAVLRDLIVNPWPFAYSLSDTSYVLRAPIGMFLIPALAGKIGGLAAAEIALLVQNSLVLTILLALASTLITGRRHKLIALATFLAFSGMDVIGQALRTFSLGTPFPDHFEGWAGVQFSSHVTLAFWAPQHALSGWIGALAFLLWRRGILTVGAFGAIIPLLCLLSPLGAMGVLPFAVYAGLKSLRERRVKVLDIILSVSGLILALPSLLYLSAAGEKVGIRTMELPPLLYVLFELIEVVPYLLAALILVREDRSERQMFILISACLLLMPFVQVGQSADFVMRASIAALALLSFQVAAFLACHWNRHRFGSVLTIAVLLIGFITPAAEIRRAIAYHPTPRVHCSLYTAWDQVVGLWITSRVTYFARQDALPMIMRPTYANPVIVRNDPTRCWNKPWMVKRIV